MPHGEIADNKKDFIESYYQTRDTAVSADKRKKVKTAQSLRVLLLAVNYIVAALIIITLTGILMVSISSLSNMEQMHAMLTENESIESAINSASAQSGGSFVDDFFLLYEKKTEFTLLLVVLPAALILLTLIANIVTTRFVKAKTDV